MNIQLSGVVTEIKDTYFVMIVNEYPALANIVDNLGEIANNPLRKHRSAHIWIGRDLAKLIKSTGQSAEEAITDLGAFRIQCTIKKCENGNVNITTSGRPVLLD